MVLRPARRLRKGATAPMASVHHSSSHEGLSWVSMSGDGGSRLTKVADLFGSLAAAAIEEKNGHFSIGYREGRDVCVIARGATWEEAFEAAEVRVKRVDRLLLEQPATSNPTVATAASVPVRFVRIRRRDVAMNKKRPT